MKLAITESPAGKELYQRLLKAGAEISFLPFRSAIETVNGGAQSDVFSRQEIPTPKVPTVAVVDLSVFTEYVSGSYFGVSGTAGIPDEGELPRYLSEYESLCRAGFERTIFFCPRYALHAVEGDKFVLTSDFMKAGSANHILESVEKLLPQFTNDYIPAPQKMLGDGKKGKGGDSFCTPYIDYLFEAVQSLLFEGGERKELVHLREKCEAAIREEYTRVIDIRLLNDLCARAQSRDIVLIAPTDRFARDFREKYGREIFEYIPYTEDSDLTQIESRIREIRMKSGKAFFVVPELFWHGENRGIIGAVYRAGYWPDRDLKLYEYRQALPNFIGYYRDIFNNQIEAQSVIKALDIRGCGISVMYEKGEMSNVTVKANHNATIRIAAKCTGHSPRIWAWAESVITIGNVFFQDAEIRAHTFSKLEIGNDCIFSNSQMIYSGDGHAIFAVLDEKTKKTERVNRPENCTLRIGNHVWVGYRCHILTGADIGDGCMVGAGSFVSKKFPNNCVIAGVPARIIHRNRVWDRNWTIPDTDRNSGLAPYIRETKEDQDE